MTGPPDRRVGRAAGPQGDKPQPLAEPPRCINTTRSNSCARGEQTWPIHTVDDLPAQQPEERATRHDAGESQGFSGERGERSQAPEDAHCVVPPAGSSRTGGVRNQTSGCPRPPPRGRVTAKGTGSIPGGQECPGGHTGMRTCPKSPSRVLKVPARHRAWHLHVIII